MKHAVEISNLSVDYRVDNNEVVHALRDVNLSIKKGETIAVVGESGCGKSTLASAMLHLLP
jgi:ABC-type glutathione transport system ATPase component